MFQEEIARLTGKLVFQVDNRPLATFEKKLGGVLTMLRELSTLANKKFTVKVSLDSKSLRSQIEKATKTKISLTNVDISHEALAVQGKRIQEYLNKTTINLKNVRFDVEQLIGQKRFIKTLMGQMSMELPIKVKMATFEAELRRDLKGVSERNPLKIKLELNNNNLAMKLRRAMIEAQKRMGELKIRVSDPQVRLKVDKQHLIEEIRAAINSSEFKIRIGASRDVGGTGGSGRGSSNRDSHSRAGRGLHRAADFAMGAVPGVGAMFAFNHMNDINQKVVSATNSLEAVSGSKEKFDSNRNFVDNLAKEQGLNFRDVAPQYSAIYQSASPAIGTKGTQDMFRGISEYGITHGLSKEAMKGSFVALSQMFGKGKIQSEEARQQFSDRMPNGMALLAQAAFQSGQIKNNTVKDFGELMKKGNADPTKILPELGRIMKQLAEDNEAYARALDTTRVKQGQMNKTFEETVVLFAKSGFDKGMASFFGTVSDQLQRSTPLVKALGGAFEVLVRPMNALVRIIGYMGKHWDEFAAKLGVSSKALAVFASTMAIAALPFGGFIVTIGALALALDDLLTYFDGGDSFFGKLVEDIPGAQEQIDSINQSLDHLKEGIDNIGDSWDVLKTTIKGAFDIELENPLVVALRTISGYIDNIGKVLDHIAAVMRGDWTDGLKGLGSDVYDMAQEYPLIKMRNYLMNKGADYVGQAADGIGSWAGSGWHPTDSAKMPYNSLTPIPGVPASAQQSQVVNLGGISLTVTAPESVDPAVFAAGLGPHIQELSDQALRTTLANARAQQAQRE